MIRLNSSTKSTLLQVFLSHAWAEGLFELGDLAPLMHQKSEGGKGGRRGGREGVQGRLSLLRVRSFLQLWLAFFFANACLDQEGAEEQEPRKS